MDHRKRCSHGAEIEALLRRQQELITQLRALILPRLLLPNGNGSAELAVQLFDDIIGCNTGAVSMLLSARGGAPVDDKSLVRKNSTVSTASADDDMVDRLEEHAMPSSSGGRKRRRKYGKGSRSLVTSVPDYDGHQWRKYGHKSINGSQHARSYYRCSYSERNCPATRTIQQQDRDGGTANNGDRAAKYTVVYYGDHTCKAGDGISNSANGQLPILVDVDVQSGEKPRVISEKSEFENELDVPALLEVFDNSLLNWETVW